MQGLEIQKIHLGDKGGCNLVSRQFDGIENRSL